MAATTTGPEAPSGGRKSEIELGKSGCASQDITGIGSLPHHNVDAALEYSFRMGIPFLPQIPIRNPWEFMIAQALEGLPGLQIDADGSAALNVDVWATRAKDFSRQLSEAFGRPPSDRAAFERFEPSAAVSSSWQAFTWEIGERGVKYAKVQISGPMTAQWALRILSGVRRTELGTGIHADLESQIYRLVLARAIAMTRRIRDLGALPFVYLDEPGLYGLSLASPRHVLGLQELKLMVQTLRKEGACVGLHCCSNTQWEAVLGLGLDILSIDAGLSLGSLLEGERASQVESFVREGGRLSLGVIPTGRPPLLRSLRAAEIHEQLIAALGKAWPLSKAGNEALTRKTLEQAIFTPACGLALHSVADAELILELLLEFEAHCRSRRASKGN